MPISAAALMAEPREADDSASLDIEELMRRIDQSVAMPDLNELAGVRAIDTEDLIADAGAAARLNIDEFMAVARAARERLEGEHAS